MSEGPAPGGAEIGVPRAASRVRKWLGFGVLALVLVAVSYTVARNRRSFLDTLRDVGPSAMAVSLLFGLIGVAATFFQWRAVLAGLDAPIGVRAGAQVFFVSQLGKYLPGSVWPIVMQMEVGRAWGANRKTIVAANLVTLVLSVAVGILLAGLLLPFSFPTALRRFWWALAALPLTVALAHPRSLPFLLDRLLRLLRRQPLGARMTTSATIRASGWSGLSWLGLGLHLAVLCAAIGKPSVGLVALSIGGMGLAISAGVLFLPAPAGAGMREIVLGYVLVSILTSGQAIAVVVASRVILILVDLILAASGPLLARSRTTAAA